MEVQNKFHLVIPSGDGRRLLIRRNGLTCSLPFVSSPEDESSVLVESWKAQTEELCTLISTALGVDCYVVTILWDRRTNPTTGLDVILQIDLLRCDFAPCNGLQWIHRPALLAADWNFPHQDLEIPHLLTAFFSRIDGNALQSLSPWRAAGWFQDVESWTLSVIKNHGMRIHGRLKQVRNMCYSTVLSCEVEGIRIDGADVDTWRASRSIYVKASQLTVPEPKMTLTVSSVMQGVVPKVLAVDEKRNAMIQIGAEPSDLQEPKLVMEMLADLHIASIQRIDILKAGGVPDRGVAWLSSNIDHILGDPILDRCRQTDRIAGLRARISEIQHVCKRLSEYGIPETLVHGDFNESNICTGVEPGSTFSLIDWSDCCISHPFLDLARLMVEETWEGNPYRDLKEVYFQKWTAFSCQQGMAEAFPLIWPLFACSNLNALLDMYKASEPVEQASMLRRIEGRLAWFADTLDEVSENSKEGCVEVGDDVSTYHFLIPSVDGGSILARRCGRAMSLPSMSPPRTGTSLYIADWTIHIGRLQSAINAELGLKVYPLAPIWARPDTVFGIEEVLLVLELLDDKLEAPDGLEWVSRQDVLRGEWEVIHKSADLKTLLSTFMQEASDGVASEESAPWRTMGWLEQTLQWIESQLLGLHMQLVVPVEIVRNLSGCCVLRCTVRQLEPPTVACKTLPNAIEVLYVKTAHLSLPEAKISRAISSIANGIAPQVLAADEARNTYIQRDAGELDDATFSPKLLMQTLAAVQTRSIDHLDTLKGAGMPVFSTAWLHSHIEGIMKNSLLDMCELKETVEKIRTEIPRLEGCILELSSYSIPDTLVHGDFQPENVGALVGDKHYQIFDWSNAYIGHPFDDFAFILLTADDPEIDQEEAEKGYFGSWKKYGNVQSLRRVSQLALVSCYCINLYRIEQGCKQGDPAEVRYVVGLLKESMDCVLYGLEALFKDADRSEQVLAT